MNVHKDSRVSERTRYSIKLHYLRNSGVKLKKQKTRLIWSDSYVLHFVLVVILRLFADAHRFLLPYQRVKLQTLWPEVTFPLSNSSKCRIPEFLRAAYLCGVRYIWTCPQAPSGHRGHIGERRRLPNKLRPLPQACNFTFPHLAGK